MAKQSKNVRNRQRADVVGRYAQRRAELKQLIRTGDVQQQDAARRELSAQPRDASPTRLRNRDAIDGRPRGYLRAFGVSRIRMRDMAHDGQLPGVRKASW